MASVPRLPKKIGINQITNRGTTKFIAIHTQLKLQDHKDSQKQDHRKNQPTQNPILFNYAVPRHLKCLQQVFSHNTKANPAQSQCPNGRKVLADNSIKLNRKTMLVLMMR